MSPFVNPWSELLRALWLSSFVSRRRRWFTVFVPVALVYLMTGNYGPVVFIDAAAAFHPAWHLVHHGHLWVDDGALRIWMFLPDENGHLVSNRPIGLIGFAVPFYAALSPFSAVPTAFPSIVAVSLATAAGVANLGLLLEEVLEPAAARWGAYIAGFGTSLWSVAAAEYLPHGVDLLLLTSALLALSARRDLMAGGLLGVAILTRPHLAVVALILGVGAAYHHRFRSLLLIGVPAAAGLLALMSSNWWIFGSFNVQGGYDEHVTTPFSATRINATASNTDFLENVAGHLVSGPRGLLTLSPFLLLLIPGLRRGWAVGPWWIRWAAVAGCGYMAVQLLIQNGQYGYLGGGMIYAYRYPLEFLTLQAVLLGASWREWVKAKHRNAAFAVLAALSVWIHAIGAVLYEITAVYAYHAWFAWSPAVVLLEQNPVVVVLTVMLLAALLPVVIERSRAPARRASADVPS